MLEFCHKVTSLDFATHYAVNNSETLADYIWTQYQSGESINTIAEEIAHLNYSVDVKHVKWASVVLAVVKQHRDILTGEFRGVYLYEEELEHLRQIQDTNTRKFLYIALIVHKWNNHPSGWVRYEREDFFKFWGLSHLKTKEKEEIAQLACGHGMDLRVVGSKNPVICYNLSFRKEDGEVVAMYDNAEQIKDWWEWLGI